MNASARRRISIATLLAVLWTALWPLLSSAHALAAADAMPLCHMAGMQVGAGEAAMDPADGTPQPAKQHCPLCIMAFLALPSTAVSVAAEGIAPSDLSSDFRSADRPADLSTRLPESRAPPRIASI